MTDIFGPLESTNGVKGVMVVNFYDDRITSTIFRDQSEAKDLFCKLREVHVLINWYIYASSLSKYLFMWLLKSTSEITVH